MEIPTITTLRLLLRGFTAADFEPLHAMVSDRTVIQYFPRSEPWPAEVVQRWMNHQAEHWRKHGFGWWALADRQSDALIGWCGLNLLDETQEVEVLYLLDKPFWGRGLATEAARWSVENGLRKIGLENIIGLTHPNNIGSQRVLEKSGLIFTNQARYFGMELHRYVIGRTRAESFYSTTFTRPHSALPPTG